MAPPELKMPNLIELACEKEAFEVLTWKERVRDCPMLRVPGVK